MADQLQEQKCLAKNREYHSYLGKYKGRDILITSHGIGSPGAAICFQELIDAGAKFIIRVGTAGGFYEGAKIGDLVIPTASIRKEGTSAAMIPLAYPAVADLDLTLALTQSLTGKNVTAKRGLVMTSDLFYPGKLPNDFALYRDAGALAVEMECSTLFIVSQLRNIRSAAVVIIDGMPLSPSTDSYDPRPERLAGSMAIGFQAALEVLVQARE